MSISKATHQSAQVSCKVSSKNFDKEYIHWYRQKPNQGFEYLLYVRTSYNARTLAGKNKKIEASKNFPTSTSTLKINFLTKEDEAMYYCALWMEHSVGVPRITYPRTIPTSVPTHILLNMGNHSAVSWACALCSTSGASQGDIVGSSLPVSPTWAQQLWSN
jgi:hypothetical protein